jgi:hypothetical protein
MSGEAWTRAVGAETLLANWFAASLVLMANALIFFHMARVKTLELKAGPAGLIAFGLIMGSIVLMIGSTCIYAHRSLAAADHLPKRDTRNERRIVFSTLTFFAMMSSMTAVIAYVVLRGGQNAINAWALDEGLARRSSDTADGSIRTDK